jgi:cyclopropane fatty-acyl-phospholipid synthase-like methyltransferase
MSANNRIDIEMQTYRSLEERFARISSIEDALVFCNDAEAIFMRSPQRVCDSSPRNLGSSVSAKIASA